MFTICSDKRKNKMLKLSEQVIFGLKSLKDLPQRKRLISSAAERVTLNGSKFLSLMSLNSQKTHFYFLDIPTNPEVYSNNSDLVKQSEYATVCLFFNCVKYNSTSEVLNSELINLGVPEEVVADFIEIYEEKISSLIEKSLLIGHNIPVVNDVSWKLQTQIKGPTENQTNVKINFGDAVEFVCNKEELQGLISQLKEIERHCESFTK